MTRPLIKVVEDYLDWQSSNKRDLSESTELIEEMHEALRKEKIRDPRDLYFVLGFLIGLIVCACVVLVKGY